VRGSTTPPTRPAARFASLAAVDYHRAASMGPHPETSAEPAPATRTTPPRPAAYLRELAIRLLDRWRGYWLEPGGRTAAAVVRIAVAVSMLWMLWRMAGQPRAASQFYYRHGIWMLYPGRPDEAVLAAVTAVAWIATAAMLVGLWTRLAHVASAITTMALAAYAVSDNAAWSHTDVPPVLATLALLGARSGDALSIDAWWRARRGRPAAVGANYLGAVRLVQFAVAAVFVFAGYEKLRSGGTALAWALSDNLRHQLLTRFDWSGAERTAAARWLLGAAWRYQLCASMNLVSQVSPLLAVIFVRRPWLRALVGALWCSEVVGLGMVMGFWNPHWLPLGAAFIDWDALAARLGARRPVDPPPRSRARLWYATAFVVFFAAQGFWLNERLHAYPFSRFALFGTVRAKPPYRVHQTYELPGGHLEVLPAAPEVDAWLAQRGTYRWLWRERNPDTVRQALANVLDDARRAWPAAGLTGARLWLSIFQAPAYPAPARLDRFDVAVLGELDRGAFRSAIGTILPDGKTWIAPPGAPALAQIQLFEIRNDLPAPVAVAATPTPTGFVLADPLRGDPVYLIGRTADQDRPWLVAFRSRRGF
jgi:hypothetical protein